MAERYYHIQSYSSTRVPYFPSSKEDYVLYFNQVLIANQKLVDIEGTKEILTLLIDTSETLLQTVQLLEKHPLNQLNVHSSTITSHLVNFINYLKNEKGKIYFTEDYRNGRVFFNFSLQRFDYFPIPLIKTNHSQDQILTQNCPSQFDLPEDFQIKTKPKITIKPGSIKTTHNIITLPTSNTQLTENKTVFQEQETQTNLVKETLDEFPPLTKLSNNSYSDAIKLQWPQNPEDPWNQKLKDTSIEYKDPWIQYRLNQPDERTPYLKNPNIEQSKTPFIQEKQQNNPIFNQQTLFSQVKQTIRRPTSKTNFSTLSLFPRSHPPNQNEEEYNCNCIKCQVQLRQQREEIERIQKIKRIGQFPEVPPGFNTFSEKTPEIPKIFERPTASLPRKYQSRNNCIPTKDQLDIMEMTFESIPNDEGNQMN